MEYTALVYCPCGFNSMMGFCRLTVSAKGQIKDQNPLWDCPEWQDAKEYVDEKQLSFMTIPYCPTIGAFVSEKELVNIIGLSG